MPSVKWLLKIVINVCITVFTIQIVTDNTILKDKNYKTKHCIGLSQNKFNDSYVINLKLDALRNFLKCSKKFF